MNDVLLNIISYFFVANVSLQTMFDGCEIFISAATDVFGTDLLCLNSACCDQYSTGFLLFVNIALLGLMYVFLRPIFVAYEYGVVV